MSNGSGPPILTNAHYQTIKDGTCVSGGTYDGCVQVRGTYYSFENGGTYWELVTGEPSPDQVKMTDGVWDKCKSTGTLTWDSRGEYWKDSQSQHYRWDGNAGEDIELVEI